MAFFAAEKAAEEVEEKQHDVVDDRKLALMQSFEARLWELDVQVRQIKCVGFGDTGPPSQLGGLVLRCSQVGVAIVQRGSDGFFPLSLWPQSRPLLLAEQVGAEHFELTLVTAARGLEVRELLFLSPVSLQELDTLVRFMLSYHDWCG